MAGRRKYRSGKSAYKFTARRKSALHRAQLISARKRKRNGNIVKVGILAGGVAIGVLGHKYKGQAGDVAKSVKHKFRSTDPGNTKSHVVAQDAKEAVMKTNAASPASAARQAPPVNSPNMNNNSAPAPSTNNGPAAKGVPGFGGIAQNAKSTQNLPSAGAVIDPAKPVRSPFPAEHIPTIDQVMSRINYGKADSDKIGKGQVTRQDIGVVSLMWSQEKLKGIKIKDQKWSPSVGYIGIYTNLLDQFGLETARAERERNKGKA